MLRSRPYYGLDSIGFDYGAKNSKTEIKGGPNMLRDYFSSAQSHILSYKDKEKETQNEYEQSNYHSLVLFIFFSLLNQLLYSAFFLHRTNFVCFGNPDMST